MTDGNTGFHVAPVAEDEAMNLASMFRKAADAVVQASTFPKQVADLEAKVQHLSDELSRKSVHAEELDRSLHEVREQRDQARSHASHLETDLSRTNRYLEHTNRTISEQQTKLETMSHDLDTTKAERDNYGLRAMQLEDEVKAWKERAEQGRKKLNDMLSLFKPDEPEPVVEAKPAEPTPSAPEPKPAEPVYHDPLPEPAAEPHPVQATSEPEPFTWDKPYHWDADKQTWVNDPVTEPTKPNDDIPF